MPNGKIQIEFTDTLAALGKWMAQNGTTIYGTRGNVLPAQEWGVITAKSKTYFVHILNKNKLQQPYVFIPGMKEKVNSAMLFADRSNIKFKQEPEGLFVYLDAVKMDDTDTIIQLTLQ